jgi:magnesium transporter
MDGAWWTELVDPDEAALRAALPPDVHPSVVERLAAPAAAGLRPRLETQGSYVFGLLMVPVERARAEVAFHTIGLVLTADRLVTAEHSPDDDEQPLCSTVRAAALRAGDGPSLALHRLMDEIAERFLAFVDDVDADIDELEDNVMAWPSQRVRGEISRLRHDILHVRRVLTPTRDAARAVLDDRVEVEGVELFPRHVEVHFADVYDKLLRAADDLELSRDLLGGVRDYHQGQIATDQNEVMKRLTAVASLLLLPTFIVGLYGQNLRGVPEFGWEHGYAWSWAVIVVTTVLQLVWFRRRRWI